MHSTTRRLHPYRRHQQPAFVNASTPPDTIAVMKSETFSLRTGSREEIVITSAEPEAVRYLKEEDERPPVHGKECLMRLDAKTLPLLVLIATACATAPDTRPQAVATLEGKSGANAFGVVTFTEMADGSVSIQADLSNVPPGLHGFHLHETGDCSAPDASSAGGHFNPGNQPHGAPDDVSRHAGDLGNIEASSSGRASHQMATNALTVSPGARSVVGRAVVLHADADDLESQPSGAAGARIACGVVNRSPE